MLLLLNEKCLNNAFKLSYKAFTSLSDSVSDVHNVTVPEAAREAFLVNGAFNPVFSVIKQAAFILVEQPSLHWLRANVQIHDFVLFINTS